MLKNRFKNRNAAPEALTAGEFLKHKRLETKFSTQEIGKKLGIKAEYLDSLENRDYKNLPPKVYVHGFIRSYANFLDADADQLIKMYGRETSFLRQDPKSEEKKLSLNRKIDFGIFPVITPKILTFAAALMILLAFGYYAFHQISSFNSKPYLYVETPAADAVVSENTLVVSGKAEKDATVKLNGQEISVSADGSFQQEITLSEGRNIIVIEAKNRFNKTESKEINVIYEKAEDDSTIEELEEKSDDAADENSSKNPKSSAEEYF